MVDMRRDGMSYPQIAEAVGVDEKTARNVVKNSGSDFSEPEYVKGKDGKTYPAKKRRKPKPRQQ